MKAVPSLSYCSEIKWQRSSATPIESMRLNVSLHNQGEGEHDFPGGFPLASFLSPPYHGCLYCNFPPSNTFLFFMCHLAWAASLAATLRPHSTEHTLFNPKIPLQPHPDFTPDRGSDFSTTILQMYPLLCAPKTSPSDYSLFLFPTFSSLLSLGLEGKVGLLL